MKRIILFFLFIVVVFPNVLRNLKYLLVLLFLVFLIKNINKAFFNKYSTYLFLGLSISILYIAVGHLYSKQPYISALQSTAVYVVFPAFWIIFCDYLFMKFSADYLKKYLILLGIIGCISIFFVKWLTDNNYYEIASFFIEDPKASVSSRGIIEVRLNVYGGLLFLVPATMSVLKSYSLVLRILLFAFIFVSVVYSGRSVLLISLALGIIGYLSTSKNVIRIVIATAIFLGITNLIIWYFEFPIDQMIELFIEKVTEGGEENARTIQFWKFLKGIEDNYYLFGHGHGVGIDYIRHKEFHWRGYELLPMATIFRTGLIGAVIYSLPFVYSLRKYYSLYKSKKHNQTDTFFFFGILGIFVGIFTNPYLESFDFQLLFFIGFCYFKTRLNSNFAQIK